MSHKWSCSNCGYVVDVATPPEVCPSCKQNCAFIDAACYTPECGGPESGNIDPRLVGGGKQEIEQ
jgi:rubredoxin